MSIQGDCSGCSTTPVRPVRDAGDEDVLSEMGFVGPLEYGDGERCPFCGNDPLDPTLHAETCRTVIEGLCGVMTLAGGVCVHPDDVDRDGFHHEHIYTTTTAPVSGVAARAKGAGDE